jgi:hypothetical protein
MHGPSLAFGSCAPPAQSSPRLTVGTADLWVVAQGAAMEPISRTFDPQFRALLKSA